MSKLDIICDRSHKQLVEVPPEILSLTYLKMLYLEDNFIEKLADDFFTRLPHLTYIDLRYNKLKVIPKSIGEHIHLETLLLQNNQLLELPNELGLLSTLKVLQIRGNPLLYPPRDIQFDGVASICNFLKSEYDKVHKTDAKENVKKADSIKTTKTTTKEKISVQQLLRQLSKSNLISSQLPSIAVKSLSKVAGASTNKETNEDAIKNMKGKKFHKVTKTCSKLSIHSHYTNKYLEKKVRNIEMKIDPKELKEMWLNKLRDLLTDQEKILQQERNLTAMSSWRLDKKHSKASVQTSQKRLEAPFDTSEEYNKMLSRKDISPQIQKMIKKRTPIPKQNVDIEKLINDVISQLKNIQTDEAEKLTPRSKSKASEKEIHSILSLHKQISSIKKLNDKS